MKYKIKYLFMLCMSFGVILMACTNNDVSSDSNNEEASEGNSEEVVEETSFETDVLVIGGGGAGMIATLSAAEENVNVIMVEEMPVYGGATAISSGKIPAVNTAEQEEEGIEDSVEELKRDINRAGQYTQNQELLDVAVSGATPIKEWLEEQGIEWTLETDSLYYGQTLPRIHVAERGGIGIVDILEQRIEEQDNIIGLKNMPATGLISNDNGEVIGAIITKNGQEIEIMADKVILATSGFGANEEMVQKYVPSIEDAVPNVAPGATGEGIEWGVELGGGTKAMNAYQGYAPISFETHASLGSAFLDNGGILVNENGVRFINEYVGYSPLATAITSQEGAAAYMIWNEAIHQLEIPAIESLTEDELIIAESPEELAQQLDIDEGNLVDEVNLYQEGIEAGEDYLNRTKLPENFEGPYYAVKVTADFRHTQGGLEINPETTEVLLASGEGVISNLYAAGGVTEGFSSNGDANYMAGNGLLQAFVFGRIAGLEAANSVENSIDTEEFNQQRDSLISISNIKDSETETSDTQYEDGEYTGTGNGHNGPIEVTVVVENNTISDVQINNHEESESISDLALEQVPQDIVDNNNPDAEVVSGATVSSEGIIEAVQNALADAVIE